MQPAARWLAREQRLRSEGSGSEVADLIPLIEITSCSAIDPGLTVTAELADHSTS
jgi:hypothetical protein